MFSNRLVALFSVVQTFSICCILHANPVNPAEPCPVIDDDDPPAAVVFYHNPSISLEIDPHDETVSRIVDYPPSVRYALWADGRFVWARGHANHKTGPEYVIGHVSPDAITQFYQRIEMAQEEYAEVRFAAAFPPGSGRIVTAIASNEWYLYMGTRHEVFDGSNGLIATEGMTRQLQDGETPDSVLAKSSSTYINLRNLWAITQAEFESLVISATIDRVESEELFHDGRVDFEAHPQALEMIQSKDTEPAAEVTQPTDH